MFDALNRNACSQYLAEHVELGTTEALAGGRRGADRAVVLQQQESAGVCAPFCHVAFARADLCQTGDARPQRPGAGERHTVCPSGLLLARTDEALQCGLAQRRAHGIDQPDRELGVGVREPAVR